MYKDSHKRLIVSRERKKERKKEVSYSLSQVYTIMNSFIFVFIIHEATWYIRFQSYRQHKSDTMEVSKSYLQVIWSINQMMEENLFVM